MGNNIVAEKSPLLIERTHSEMGWGKTPCKSYPTLRVSVLVYGETVKIEWISDKIIEGCFGSPFSHVLSFHNLFLYISNITDIFIMVQKIISWKAGETELICLHGGLRFSYIGRMDK